MRIMVFLQGTVLMHKNAAGKTRKEIIAQVKEQEESIWDFENYIPIGKAPLKLKKWADQGAEICYLSVLTENKRARGDELIGKEGLEIDEIVLKRYDFPIGAVYHRGVGEEYRGVVEKATPLPDILIEDDCESIGAEEMTYPSFPSNLKQKIKSIVVPEFGGIDHLPDLLEDL